jgi:hypothetical protein
MTARPVDPESRRKPVSAAVVINKNQSENDYG